MTIDRAAVEAALETVRPALKADGGDVELVDASAGGIVFVRFAGACQGCAMRATTLSATVERAVKKAVPGVKAVELVETDEEARR